MDIYVKNTSNCSGLPLTSFEELSPTWSGDSVVIPCGEPPKKRKVIGWTDLRFGSPCRVSVTKVQAPGGEIGFLVWGGNSGLRIPALDYGTQIIWVSTLEELPTEVQKVVGRARTA